MKRTDSTRRGRPRASSLEALQNHERFQLLVSSIRDYAVIILDREGRILTWNEGAERMKGWSADEIVGTSFEAFYPPEAVATGFPQEELEMAARDGRFEDENWRVRKDGSRFWANVVITALHGARGEVIGYGKVTRDLTDRREAEEQARRLAAERAAREEASKRSDELQELNARLQTALADAQNARDAALRSAAATAEAYAELDQFAYVASHDLKAPLRGIASLAQWIQDDVGEKLTGESADHMRLLHGRVQRMQGLIDGILVYSRAGRTLTTPERVQVGRLVDEVVELLPIPEGVIVDVQPEMPTLQAERVPLQQVFMNLIGNAVKYATAVRPDVLVRVGWRDVGDYFEFEVADNGPGIPPEFHDRVWGIFQMLSPRDQVEGTGIGLSVVKKIVESRGGQVSLESAPSQGTAFRFTWPKAPSGDPA